MNDGSTDHPHEPPAGAEYPSELRITSKPFEQSSEAMLDGVDRWEAGEDVPHVVNFQDASRLQRVLTPRRLELIEQLMEAPASSIRALADRLERDVRQVHDDVTLLAEYRIVHLRESGGAKQAVVPYDTVTIEVELSTASDADAEEPSTA